MKTASERGRASRRKGISAERELFRVLSDLLGQSVTRNLSQTRDAGCDSISIEGFAIECKRVETAFQGAWMLQAMAATGPGHEIPVVFYRASRQPWKAALRLSDLTRGRDYYGLAHVALEDAVVFIKEILKMNSDLKEIYARLDALHGLSASEFQKDRQP